MNLRYVIGKTQFSLHDFHERVKLGLKDKSTLKVMIYGEDAEVKVLEGQNKILSAIYDEEKTDPKLISKEKLKEVSEVVQMQVEEVQDVLDKYEQLNGFHKFLVKRKDKGEPMPENRHELNDIYRYEKPAFLMDTDNQPTITKSNRKYYLRRKYT